MLNVNVFVMFVAFCRCFCCFCFLAAWALTAKAEVVPETKENPKSSVSLQLLPEDEPLPHPSSLSEQTESMLIIGRYFHEKYPGNLIDGDIYDDVRLFFPDLKGQDVIDRAMLIRDAVKFYRFFYQKYQDFKSNILLPEEQPLILPDNQYEKPYTHDYIDSPDLVVINDFTKVVSYSSEKKDFEAYEKKLEEDYQARSLEDKFAPFNRLHDIFSKLELKKFLFYGNRYSDPLTQGKGNGNWVEINGAKVRLATEFSALNNLPSLRAIVHFSLPRGTFLLFSGGNRPEISFSGANFENAQVFYPLPQRLRLNNHYVLGYSGNFAIPVLINVRQPMQNLALTAEVKAELCSENNCQSYTFSPEISLEAGFGYASTSDNFLVQSFNSLPKKMLQDVEILSLSAGKNHDGQDELRLRLLTDYKPSEIDVLFDDDTLFFGEPRFTAHDGKVDIFLPIEGKSPKLQGKTFDFWLKFGEDKFLKSRMSVEEIPWSDLWQIYLTPVLFLAAFVGGLLLNFMPCVFPVLALKFLSVYGNKKSSRKNIRKNFLLAAAGIFCAFFLLILLLLILKSCGYALGWGMQFQNGAFLTFMLFAMALFVAHILNLAPLSTPLWIQKLGVKNKGVLQNWIAGILTVALATPCTAPYLATAVGFALTTTPWVMTAVLFTVACGLAFPYFLFALFPTLIPSLPRSGKWMEKTRLVLLLMMFAAMAWLICILSVQISFAASVRLVSYLLLFFFLLACRQKIKDKLKKMHLSPLIRAETSKLVSRIFFALVVVLLVVAAWDMNHQFKNTESQQNSQNVSDSLNEEKIQSYLNQGKKVLLVIDAKWCLTCHYNDFTVFENPLIEETLKNRDVVLMRVDWTRNNQKILDFMSRYGRNGVPFSVLFTPDIRGGVVLPEILTPVKLRSFLTYSSN